MLPDYREFRRRRRLLEMTQAEVASRAGLSKPTIVFLESGTHSPNVRTVERIGRVLDEAEAAVRAGKEVTR